MSSVVMNLFKGQRMDITAQMKDADAILVAFRQYGIRFDKKYTTIGGSGPSTITFKGLKAEKANSDLVAMISYLHQIASENKIDNVYVKISGFSSFKKNEKEKSKAEKSIEDQVQDILNEASDESEDSTL